MIAEEQWYPIAENRWYIHGRNLTGKADQAHHQLNKRIASRT
jgi:hypothetical protein